MENQCFCFLQKPGPILFYSKEKKNRNLCWLINYLLDDGDEDKGHQYFRMGNEIFLLIGFDFSQNRKTSYKLARSNFSETEVDFNFKVIIVGAGIVTLIVLLVCSQSIVLSGRSKDFKNVITSFSA